MAERIEHVTESRRRYSITMQGVMDGVNSRDPVGYGNYHQTWEPNVFVSIENSGDEILVNPWITVNGKRNWRSVSDILAESIEPGMTEAEKARAIWEFARHNRYHATTGDDEVKDTVKMLNCYGYTPSWDEAFTLSNLWQAAGLAVRRGLPHGHCTTEVYYDGAYHLLDSDESLLYLLRDNQTVAGEEDLARDHDLVRRGHAYGVQHAENRQTGERTAGLFVHEGPRADGRPTVGGHRMDLTLRPGETLLWEWDDRGKFHGYEGRPPRLCNGRLQYTPLIAAEPHRWSADAENVRCAPEGIVPADTLKSSQVTWQIDSPYVMVGGKIMLAGLNVTALFSYEGETWTDLNADSGSGSPQVLSLNGLFPPASPAHYTFYVRFTGPGLTLNRLLIETDLQMAPLYLPALESGANDVLYTDETVGARSAIITHGWYEKSVERPTPPPNPVFPLPNTTVDGSQFTFVWEPTPDAVDYHIQVSDRPDMKVTLSPVFDRLVSCTPSAGMPEWQIPGEGLLNPGHEYFWRVRGKAVSGLWSAWSAVWAFTPDGPGLPFNLRLTVDRNDRTATLLWDKSEEDVFVPHYEVYGSDERGFTASREPYEVFKGGEEGTAHEPANLIGTSENNTMRVIGDGGANRCYYRVVAVDAKGHRSGPSDHVEAPRPFLYSEHPPAIPANTTVTHQFRAIRSIGDLRAVSDGPHRYQLAFREGDVLRYLLDEGPSWLSLDEASGLLTLTPHTEHVGLHAVTVRVLNGQGGADAQGFELRVIPNP